MWRGESVRSQPPPSQIREQPVFNEKNTRHSINGGSDERVTPVASVQRGSLSIQKPEDYHCCSTNYHSGGPSSIRYAYLQLCHFASMEVYNKDKTRSSALILQLCFFPLCFLFFFSSKKVLHCTSI